MSKFNLAQLKSVNSRYNIFTSIRIPKSTPTSGSLANTTSSIKDIFSTRHEPTTCGSKILQEYIAPYDSTACKLLEKEGTLIIGKTNMDEFGMGNSTLNSNFGPTLNPLYDQSSNLIKDYKEVKFWTPRDQPINTDILYNEPFGPEKAKYESHTYLKPIVEDKYEIDSQMKIVGGSSGGTAASVASDLCDFAIGTDTGGSIRLPACFTSTIGFKPSYGRISRWGLVSYAQSLDTVGIISKDLKLVNKVFKVLDRYDDNDPTSIANEKRNNEFIQTNEKIKIGIPSEFQLDNLDAEIKKQWIDMLSKLQESKLVEIYPISVPSIKSSLPTYYTLVTSEASSNLSRFDGIRYGFRSDKFTETEPEFTFTRDMGFSEEVKRRITLGTFSLSSYGYKNNFIKATKLRSQLIDEFNKVFQDKHPLINYTKENSKGIDFIICPTSFDLPPSTSEYYKVKPIDSYLNDVLTIPSSLAGLPTVNIPYGGKSIGFQVIGQNGYDYKVLDFCGRALECIN